MSQRIADLSHYAVLRVTGEDAAAFLHAQFTNDVQALAVDAAQWNGWCTPKGRLVATFLLVRRKDEFLMVLPSEIAGPIAKRLGMFVLRSKVKIADVSAGHARFGLVGPGAAQAAQEMTGLDVMSLPLGPELQLVIGPAGSIHPSLTPGRREDWTLALIRAGIPTIVAATQDEFVPQMANFDLIGGVSFRKGCYTGQEIVARTQYRGILKKRMAIAHVDGVTPQPGQSVYSPAFGEQSAGTVVNVAAAPEGGYDVLVVAQIQSLREDKLRLGSPDGAPVEIRRHPAEAPAS